MKMAKKNFTLELAKFKEFLAGKTLKKFFKIFVKFFDSQTLTLAICTMKHVLREIYVGII